MYSSLLILYCACIGEECTLVFFCCLPPWREGLMQYCMFLLHLVKNFPRTWRIRYWDDIIRVSTPPRNSQSGRPWNANFEWWDGSISKLDQICIVIWCDSAILHSWFMLLVAFPKTVVIPVHKNPVQGSTKRCSCSGATMPWFVLPEADSHREHQSKQRKSVETFGCKEVESWLFIHLKLIGASGRGRIDSVN